jgi:hypothetical protein
MLQIKHLARAGGLILGMALFNTVISFNTGAVGFVNVPPLATGQQEDVQIGADGSIKLLANAPPAPEIYGSFKHFGLFISPAYRFSAPFHTLTISYVPSIPHGASLRLDVRASADGARWSAWTIGLESGASAAFEISAHFVQYRATLLGDDGAAPLVRDVRILPLSDRYRSLALADEQRVAPTYHLHATREGLVGHRTANGHRITKRDHFVSLPSWRSLSSNGGHEYMVRVTYNGRSAVAPVYDVGPWNTRDNYWDAQRDRYADLPRGWPEDHAAYFDHYNGGRAEYGKVSFPTAIDIADGVWWDELGIRGDRAVLDVTFLWLGSDPQGGQPTAAPAPPPQNPPAAPPPQNPPAAQPRAEIVVDERDAAFKGRAAIKWYDGPANCGRGGHTLWTFSTSDSAESENSGRWQPQLPAEALYDVYAAIPACHNGHADTTSARYIVQHRDGSKEVIVDQAAAAGSWVLLGRFPFAAGDGGFVELADVTGDSMHSLWFDAVKWVPVP